MATASLKTIACFLFCMLWDRRLTAARNNGWARLWVNDRTPFLSAFGFNEPDEESLSFFPAGFGSVESPWWVLKLQDETPELLTAALKADQELQGSVLRAYGRSLSLSHTREVIAIAFFIALFIHLFFRD